MKKTQPTRARNKPAAKAPCTRGMKETRREFSYRLGETARLWRGYLDRQLKPLGVSFMQWSTLARLSHAGTDLVQKDLAHLVGIEGPTLVGILDRLVRAGYVERRVAAHDRRANTVHLTAEGRRLLLAAEQQLHDVRENLLAELTEAELTATIEVFQAIAKRAQAS